MIAKGGVKADELRWTGLDDWLAGKSASEKVKRGEVGGVCKTDTR